MQSRGGLMNLFLLTAPYQLLSALEAVHRFGFAENHLRIIETGHFTREQFASVVNTADWRSVRFHDFRYRLTDRDFSRTQRADLWERMQERYVQFHQFRQRLLAEWIALRSRPLDALVLGNYQTNYDGHMRHFANRLRYRRLYLLDVGTDTLRIARDRQVDHSPKPSANVEPASGWDRAKHRLRRRLLDWDTRGAERLTFFTTYDLAPSGGDQIIHNDYSFLRSVVAGAKPSGAVLFAGQPLVDQCYLGPESFRDCLAWVAASFSGQRLVYVRHPRESELQLNLVRSLGLDIVLFAAPFEYAVCFSGERPSAIASFFSSVVENCAAIFGGMVALKAFRLPPSALWKDHDEIDRLYDQFADNRRTPIEVVHLPWPLPAGLRQI